MLVADFASTGRAHDVNLRLRDRIVVKIFVQNLGIYCAITSALLRQAKTSR